MPKTVAVDETLLREHIKFGMNIHALSLLDGADPCHFVVKYNTTILHLAAQYGNEELARYLVNSGANVDAQNNVGETPLTIAVKYEHKNIIELLLRANADTTVRDIFGKCTLERAFEEMEGLREDVRRLILDSVTIDFVLKGFCRKGQAFHDDIPLYYVALLKKPVVTKIHLDQGSQINAAHKVTKRTALHEAVRLLDVDNVKLLLKYRADVNALDQLNKTPIYFIPEYNDDDDTVEIVKMLIDAGATLMYPDYKFSPMRIMLSRGSPKIVRTVLESGRDLFTVNNSKSMPIDFLFENENPAVYRELRKFNIDFKMRLVDRSLLRRVARKRIRNSIALKFLLDLFVEINARNNNKRTPLQIAIEYLTDDEKSTMRFTDCDYLRNVSNNISMLLRNGADPQIIPAVDNEMKAQADGEPMRPKPAQDSYQVMAKCIWELEFMKLMKLDESVTLFNFMCNVRVIRMIAENKVAVTNVMEVMNVYDVGSQFYKFLQDRLCQFGQLFAINEVFVRMFNVSAMGVAEKIVRYL